MKATKKKTQLQISLFRRTLSVVHIVQSVPKVDHRSPNPRVHLTTRTSIKRVLTRAIVARRRLSHAETLLKAEHLLIEAVVFIAVLCESLL